MLFKDFSSNIFSESNAGVHTNEFISHVNMNLRKIFLNFLIHACVYKNKVISHFNHNFT